VRFASLGGYVLAKAAAVVDRRLPKDLYDFAFVLLHNREGGPGAAARAAFDALPGLMTTDHPGNLRAALNLYTADDARCARTYAAQRVRDGETLPEDVLMQDAVGAALECRATFDRLTVADAR
jgi:hypothetical protein